MRYCPYCGASILDDAAFCMECGATIPVSGVPKEEPKQRAPQTKKKKHKPKPIKRRPDAPPPDPQIIVVGASAIVIVVLAIVLMKLL